MSGPFDEPAPGSDADVTRTHASTAPPVGAIGPYRLLQKLGEGGMGEVWLAEQSQPVRRQVAIKVIKAGMDTAEVVARFEAERQALAMMDHPTIAKVFDGGATPAGRPYFAMEYVRGEAITVYCDRQRLSTADRLELFVALCEGVQHAHQKGVIHRDLKPSNVLVALQGDRPVPRIIDFGVAKAIAQPLTDRSLFTQLGMLVGTPEYMSPEQAEMTPLDVDTRSDVYSLGVLLYELLVGALPFDRQLFRQAGLDDMRRTIREKNAPRPSTRVTQLGLVAGDVAHNRGTDPRKLAKQLRGDLDWIVLKALEKDRTRRYQTANALGLDIQHHLNDEPVSAGPPTAVYRMGKFAKRHRVGVSLAASVVVLVLAFAASMAVQVRRVAREAARANRAEAVALKEADTAKAVLAFLQDDVLAQASAKSQARPDTKPDPDLKVRTALERAAQGIAGKFDKQPLVEASIRQTIGTTYQDLGLYPEAQRQMERALELRRRDLGDSHDDTLTTSAQLADAYRVDGKYEQAEPLLTKVVDVRRRVFGEEHPQTLVAMNNLALVYKYQGKYAEAEPLYIKDLSARRRATSDDNIDTLTSMNNLGSLYHAQAKYEQAEPLLAQATESARHALGEEHPVTMTLSNNLALVYVREGKFAQAERLQAAVVAFAVRVLGEKHPNTLTATSNLARLYGLEGKYGEAESLFANALATGRVVQGEEHPNTLLTLQKMAELYREQGKDAQAEAIATRAMASLRRLQGQESGTLDMMEIVADIDRRQHKYAQAEALFIEILDSRRRVLGRDHPDTLSALASVGRVRLEQQRYADAETTLRNAVAEYERAAPNSWNRYDCQSMLGASLAGQNKYAEAEPLLLAGYEGMTRLRTTMPAYTRVNLARSAESLVGLYRSWNRSDKAAEWQAKVNQ